MDQPVGTGFSYTTDESDICHDEEGVSNDLYDFLQVCLLSHAYVCVSMTRETRIMHSCLSAIRRVLSFLWRVLHVIGMCQDRILRLRFTNFSELFQAFFKEHPQFAINDFYITGESYAGHYIPAFATRINQRNKVKEGIHINLKVVHQFN